MSRQEWSDYGPDPDPPGWGEKIAIGLFALIAVVSALDTLRFWAATIWRSIKAAWG